MKNKNIIGFFVMAFVLVFSAFYVLAVPATTQLAYDDGSSRNPGEEFDSPRGYKAVLFEVTGDPVSLVSVDTFWQDNTGHSSTEKYQVWIFDTGVNDWVYESGWISQPIQGVNNDPSTWNYYDVSSAHLTFDHDFYIVVNAPVKNGNEWGGSNDEMDLGFDTSGSTNSYYLSNGVFNKLQSSLWYNAGNYMIRATVQDVDTPLVIKSVDAPDVVESKSFFDINLVTEGPDGKPITVVCAHDNDVVDTSNSECVSATDSVCNIKAGSGNTEHTIYCRAFNDEDYSEAVKILYDDDNSAPIVNLKVGKEAGKNHDYSNNGNVVITPEFEDAHLDHCDISGDHEGTDISGDPIDLSVLPDGVYSYTLECSDLLGHTNSRSRSITVDTSDPVIDSFTIVEEGFDDDGIVEIDWDAHDDTSGIKHHLLYYKWASSIDGVTDSSNFKVLKKVLPGEETSFTTDTLAKDTSYTFKVKVCDYAGLCTDSDTKTTMVQNTEAPFLEIVNINDGDIFASKSVTVEADYADTSDVTCEAKVDDGSYGGMSGDGLTSGTATRTFGTLADGNHVITVECSDGIGESEGHTTERLVSFYVDTHKPNVDVIAGNKDSIPYPYANQVWAELSYDDENNGYESGFDNCVIEWGDGKENTLETFSILHKHNYASEDKYTIRVTCTDVAGNSDDDQTTITVDKTKPVTTESVSGDEACNDWYESDVTVSLTATDKFSGHPQSGIDYTKYRVKNLFNWKVYDGPFIISEEGVWSVEFQSKDLAGNVEDKNSIIVKIDKTDPAAEITFPVDTEHLADPTVLFAGTASDPGEMSGTGSGVNHVEIQIEKVSDDSVVPLPWTQAEGSNIWGYDWTANENIEYRVKAQATDNACHTGSTVIVTFTIQDDYDYRYYTKEEIDNQISDLNIQIDDLEDRTDVTEEEIESLWYEISQLGFEVNGLWDEVDELRGDLTALEGRLTALEQSVEHLWLHIDQMADFGMEYKQPEQTLKILGSGAPEGANWAEITVMTADGNFVDKKVVGVNADGTFDNVFDASEWKYESMNIYVKFYENRVWRWSWLQGWYYRYVGHLKTISDVWDGKLGELGYGFLPKPILTQTFETYYMNGPIVRYLGYGVKPHDDTWTENWFDGGLYKIRLQQITSDNGQDISTTIEECTWLDADVENDIISAIVIPAPGTYHVKLEAKKGCGFFPWDAEYFTSNDFVIDVIDLKNEQPTVSLVIVSPEKNFLEGNLGWEGKDIFWTRSDAEFTLAAAGNLNCGVSNPMGRLFGHAYNEEGIGTQSIWSELPIGPLKEKGYYAEFSETVVAKTLGTDNKGILGYGAEGIYEVMVQMYSGCTDAFNTMLIGVDDTSPDIGTIYPSEEDIISGAFTFTAEVTDEKLGVITSGVRNVDLSLILKGEEEPKWTTAAAYNAETGLWEVSLETSQIPDGSYNLKVEAWDYANNYYTETVDPMIDNNPPVLSDANIGVKVCTENNLLDLSVVAIDSTSGVDASTVYVLVTGLEGSGIINEKVVLASAGGDFYKGSFNNVNMIAGDYTVVFYASDKAKHEGSISATQTVEVVSCPAPAPTGSSGGGSGGGGGRKVTFTCNYDCGTWSDCTNGKQTRTCTPNRYCEGDTNKPETEKTCTVQTTSTQGSSTGTTEQQSETGETTDEGSDNEGNTPTGFAVAPTSNGGIITDWLRILEGWLASIFAMIFG